MTKLLIVPSTGSFVVVITEETEQVCKTAWIGAYKSGSYFCSYDKQYISKVTPEERQEALSSEWIKFPAYTDLKMAYENEETYVLDWKHVWEARRD